MKKLVFGFGFVLAASAVTATPIVRMGENRPLTWPGTNSGGFITPVSAPLSGPTNTFYQNQILANGLPNYVQQVPVLTFGVNVTDGSTTHDSLVMSWNNDGNPNTLNVASWEFAYNADPDLNNLDLNFEELAPSGIFALGVELIDTSGRSKGWYRSHPLPQPSHWDETYRLSVSGGLQGPFTDLFVDPGFDITQVLRIRMNQSSLGRDPITPPDPTGNGAAWGAWSYVDVVPEPTGLTFGLVGAVALMLRRRRV